MISAIGIVEEIARWLCAALLFGGLIGAFLLLRRREPTTPRTTCRRCGYDVRQTPDRCPECGATVPDEIRLRIDLLHGRPPAWLLDDDHALPLRDPGEGERFRPIAALQDKEHQEQLTTLLRRAGIASEVDLRLMPRHARDLLRPGGSPQRPSFEVSVTEADHAVAIEILGYLQRLAQKP